MPYIAPNLRAIMELARREIEVVRIRSCIFLFNCFSPACQDLGIDIVYVDGFDIGVLV